LYAYAVGFARTLHRGSRWLHFALTFTVYAAHLVNITPRHVPHCHALPVTHAYPTFPLPGPHYYSLPSRHLRVGTLPVGLYHVGYCGYTFPAFDYWLRFTLPICVCAAGSALFFSVALPDYQRAVYFTFYRFRLHAGLVTTFTFTRCHVPHPRGRFGYLVLRVRLRTHVGFTHVPLRLLAFVTFGCLRYYVGLLVTTHYARTACIYRTHARWLCTRTRFLRLFTFAVTFTHLCCAFYWLFYAHRLVTLARTFEHRSCVPHTYARLVRLPFTIRYAPHTRTVAVTFYAHIGLRHFTFAHVCLLRITVTFDVVRLPHARLFVHVPYVAVTRTVLHVYGARSHVRLVYTRVPHVLRLLPVHALRYAHAFTFVPTFARWLFFTVAFTHAVYHVYAHVYVPQFVYVHARTRLRLRCARVGLRCCCARGSLRVPEHRLWLRFAVCVCSSAHTFALPGCVRFPRYAARLRALRCAHRYAAVTRLRLVLTHGTVRSRAWPHLRLRVVGFFYLIGSVTHPRHLPGWVAFLFARCVTLYVILPHC